MSLITGCHLIVVSLKTDLTVDRCIVYVSRGKFGCVYRCTDKTTGRQLAAKFIKAGRVSQKADVMQEVTVMNVLHNPKLLLLWDAFESRREIVLVMEQ